MTLPPGAADPIVAVATAPGRGAVGIVRISSPVPLGAWAEALCGRPLAPREARRVDVLDADGVALDQAIALHFPAPASFTGEHVLELQGHGGPVVLQLIVQRCLALAEAPGGGGAPRLPRLRLARAGEFTERAFHHGKLDLAQAEAVADLIDADTAAAARGAARSLAGEFSQRVQALARGFEDLRTLVEATLDFPEEDIDFVRSADVAGRLEALAGGLSRLQAEARQGALLREGLDVVIAGVPNAGKSSLLNALAGQELAIVTDVPGTTRDRIRQTLAIDGVPVHVVDTAGLRATDDAVERIGVERSWQAIGDADLVLWMHDLSRADDPEVLAEERRIAGELARLRGAAATGTVLHAFNKADAVEPAAARRALRAAVEAFGAAAGLASVDEAVCLSVRDGTGLDALRAAMLARAGWQAPREGVFLARTRHLQALARAAARVGEAQAQLTTAAPALDLLAEDLRGAHRALGEITGEFGTEDLLGAIFSRFCIGK